VTVSLTKIEIGLYLGKMPLHLFHAFLTVTIHTRSSCQLWSCFCRQRCRWVSGQESTPCSPHPVNINGCSISTSSTYTLYTISFTYWYYKRGYYNCSIMIIDKHITQKAPSRAIIKM